MKNKKQILEKVNNMVRKPIRKKLATNSDDDEDEEEESKGAELERGQIQKCSPDTDSVAFSDFDQSQPSGSIAAAATNKDSEANIQSTQQSTRAADIDQSKSSEFDGLPNVVETKEIITKKAKPVRLAMASDDDEEDDEEVKIEDLDEGISKEGGPSISNTSSGISQSSNNQMLKLGSSGFLLNDLKPWIKNGDL